MPLDALPALDRTSATFKTDLDAYFLTELPAFSTQAEALRLEVNDAAASAANSTGLIGVASAAANYKGLWSALTGALNMPASVSHNGNYWALNANLANVTTATPGVSASWQALNVGAGGALETSSAANMTLTAASYRVQAVAMTAVDQSVTLPNATTMQAGGELFTIKNTGDIAYTVRDAAGTMLAMLDPGQVALLYLANATTSAGVWALSGSSGLGDAIYQATALTVNAVASTNLSVTTLSATQALVVFVGVSGWLNACTLNVSGTTVTAGAILAQAVAGWAITAASGLRVVALSATQAVVSFPVGTTSYLQAATLNISGTTVTAGTVITASSVATDFVDLTTMSATQALVVYKGTTGYPEARTLNVSGTTVTAGAACVISASVMTPGWVAGLSSTQAMAGFVASSILMYSFVLTVSGTTVAASAVGKLFQSGIGALSACAISSTQVVVSHIAANVATPRHTLLEVSGGSTVVKDMTDACGLDVGISSSLIKISESKLLAVRGYAGGNAGSTGASLQPIRISDSLLRLWAPPVKIKNSRSEPGKNAALAVLSATKVLAVYVEPTGYLQTRVLEIAP